jgi:superfamily II DNA or RNA helicase
MRVLEQQSASFSYIVSMDASRQIDLEMLGRLSPERGVDLLVLDEIHRLIGRGGEILRRRFGLTLSAMARGVIGLSATPVQLEISDLKRVMDVVAPGLLDDELFPPEIAATALINQVRTFLGRLKWSRVDEEELQRLLNELDEAAGHLPQHEREGISGFLVAARDRRARDVRTRHLLRQNSLALTLIQKNVSRARADEVGEARKREVVDLSVALDTQERQAIQSGKMVSVSERSMYENLDRFLAQSFSFAHRRQLASCLPAMIDLLRLGKRGYTRWEARDLDEDLPRDNPARLSEQEMRRCEEFVDQYGLLPRDTKLGVLRRLLDGLRVDSSISKVIVFTHWIPTFGQLEKKLPSGDLDVISVDSGSTDAEVEEAVARFEQREGFSVLLATDILREGLDLQAANCVINYDLSYNPQDLEQRIGRVDRVGQESRSIRIVNLYVQDSLDEEVYERALKRIDVFRTTVGDMRPVVEEMARKLERSGTISQAEVVRAATELQQQQDLMKHGAFAGVEDVLDDDIRLAHKARNSGLDSLSWMVLARFFEAVFPTCRTVWQHENQTLAVQDLPRDASEALRLLAGHRDRELVDAALGSAQRSGQGGLVFKLGGGKDALPATHPIMRLAVRVLADYYDVHEENSPLQENLALSRSKSGLEGMFVEIALVEFRFAGKHVRERRWTWWGVQKDGSVSLLDDIDTPRLLSNCVHSGRRIETPNRPQIVATLESQGTEAQFLEWTHELALREISLNRVGLQSAIRTLKARIITLESELIEAPGRNQTDAVIQELKRRLSGRTNALDTLDSPETIKQTELNASVRVVLTVHLEGSRHAFSKSVMRHLS